MNNNLTPTVILDKNGRKTTVHRKANRTAPAATIPAPTVTTAKPVQQKSSTQLPIPKPVAPERLSNFQKEFRGIQALSLRKTINLDEAALIRDILDRGHVQPKAIGHLSDYMGLMSAGERFKDFDYNTFQLAERYFQTVNPPGDFIHSDAGSFIEAVQGTYYRRREEDIKIERFTTEEELDSNLAVIRMMMLMKSIGGPTQKKAIYYDEYRTADDRRMKSYFLRNQAFSDLLRENPASYDEIEKYVRERGVPQNKHQVTTLKQYLANGDERTTAIADGWL